MTAYDLSVAARIDGEIRMGDGRRLAYCEWGDPQGPPLVLFHGSPGSRVWSPDDPGASSSVRLITIDRPGCGRSDPKAGRQLADWPRDVAALADALELERFSVVGYSAGGIYAAACAARIPERLHAVGVVSARHLGEYNVAERPEAYDELDKDDRAVFDLAQRDSLAAAELAAVQIRDWVQEMQENPESIWDGPAVERAPEGDKWFWADARLTRAFYDGLREGLRQGTEGYRWEAIDVLLPWGFRLVEVSVPVHIWYGVQDARFQGRGRELLDWVAGRIPNCVVVEWKDAGHMGLVKHWNEVVATLVRTPKRARNARAAPGCSVDT